jgi:glycosyltransferase involved in cell wall biosynthesis
LVKALRVQAEPGTSIDVVTTMPNRYRSFSRQAAEVEIEDGVEVRRIALPPHSSDIRGQSRAFLRFARQALRSTANRKYDVVFATSSRLMTAALGAWIARRQNAVLYLDIRDIFVDTIGDLFGSPAKWPLLRIFSRLESWTMRRADRINLVSGGFESYFRARYPSVPLALFTNGIDDEFLELTPPPTPEAARAGDKRTVILYAGNIGEGQGLHRILPGMARALQATARFVVFGDGGRRRELEAGVAGLDNVELRAPVQRSELIAAYRSADVLFLHLGDYAAFEKVLPSKLFEYGALGKPVLAGVAGYAARFVRQEIDNAAVFAPCDVSGGVAALASLQLADRARPAFVGKYARANIMRAMAQDVLEQATARPRRAR